jgi:beta-alanine--pyruvate transaminase
MKPHDTASPTTTVTSTSTFPGDARWMEAHWMPFSANRNFKAAGPQSGRMLVSAQGAYYTDSHGKKVFDGLSGLWCCGLGHGRTEITEAVSRQIGTLDYSPAFQYGHPLSFELANKITELMPAGLDHVFFTGSGSESADTALKMARAYWRAKGLGSKTRLIGREKGYHGVNFGGISVGGIVPTARLLARALRLTTCRTPSPPPARSTSGMPPTGAELADELLKLIALHDASNIAAVIVEPLSGSAGVVIPPVGYLQRLREICTANNILLIFDEVITGFGRMPVLTPGSEAFGVTPDILNIAKQVTNGAQPLGAVVAKKDIYDTFMAQAARTTCWSSCPRLHLLRPPGGLRRRRCRAGCAGQGRHDRARGALAPYFEQAVHSLKRPSTSPTSATTAWRRASRSMPSPGEPAKRPYQIAMKCLEKGFYVRYGGDTIQLAPPFIATEVRDRQPDQRARWPCEPTR